MEGLIIGLIILFGAIIMVIGIAKYRKLLDYSKRISKKRKSNISFFIKVNLAMMIFFLFGYCVIGVFLIKKISIENLLVGLIFFLDHFLF